MPSSDQFQRAFGLRKGMYDPPGVVLETIGVSEIPYRPYVEYRYPLHLEFGLLKGKNVDEQGLKTWLIKKLSPVYRVRAIVNDYDLSIPNLENMLIKQSGKRFIVDLEGKGINHRYGGQFSSSGADGI
jgi:hypothetical protein